MTIAGRLMTADELLHLPDDHLRHELIDGVLTTMPPTGDEHGGVTVNLTTPLDVFVRANRLGRVYAAETGYWLSRNPDLVRAPDVSFVTQDRVEAAGRIRGFREGAPDLAVEVLSPDDRPSQVARKVTDWLTHGTRMLIVVDPKRRRVRVHRPEAPVVELGEDDMLDGGDVLPGWELPVREIFA